jgi:hypothetical protein
MKNMSNTEDIKMKNTKNSVTMNLGDLEHVNGGTGNTTATQPKYKDGDRVYLKGYGDEEIYVRDAWYNNDISAYVYMIMSLRHGFGLAYDEDLSDRPFS